MTKFPMHIALKQCDSPVDADVEVAETKDEIIARINRLISDDSEEDASSPKETTESIDDGLSEGTNEGSTPAVAGVHSGASIAKLLEEYVDKISSYHALTNAAIAMPRIMTGAQMKTAFYDKQDEFEKLDEHGGYNIFGLRPDQIGGVSAQLTRLTELYRGMSVLPESVLLSLVATFDSYIASIALGLLKSQPKRYEDEKKMVSVKSILAMNSFDDVVNMLAESEVQDCMRGSHASQVAFLENLADVKISSAYERWPDFVEIFERRNLVAHQRTTVNSIYMANCSAAGVDVSKLSVGDELPLSATYLKSAINILIEFGTLLLFVIWRKKFKNEGEEAFSTINATAFELIGRRYIVSASRILEFALFKQNRKAQDQTIKMMIVNLANCYKKLDKPEKMNEVLDSTDWSSASDQFQVCIAAVRDEVDTVVSLMGRVKDERVVGSDGFRTWPVFDTVRSDPKFVAAFEEVFGEPLGSAYVEGSTKQKGQRPAKADIPPDSDGQAATGLDGPTVH